MFTLWGRGSENKMTFTFDFMQLPKTVKELKVIFPYFGFFCFFQYVSTNKEIFKLLIII